jgi:hypothetical protein
MKNKLMMFAVLAMCLCMGTVVQADLTVNGPVEAMTNGWMNSDGLPNGNYVQANLRTTWTGTDAGGDRKAILQTNLNWTIAGTYREANTYWEAGTYTPGEVITFNYAVLSNQLSDKGYICTAFIKDLSGGWATIQHITGDLAVLGDGSINMTVTNGAHVQVGFTIDGPADTAGSATADLAVEVVGFGKAIHPTKATGGSPDGGFANPDLTTELTWINPTTIPPLTEIYFVESATPFDPNETHPNSAKKALDAASVYDFCTNACESSAVTLAGGNYYAWRVVCDNIDPNSSDDWIFDTINIAPATSAGFDENAWLVSGTVDVDLDGTANDYDGYPGTPLTYDWTQTAGTAVTIADVEDPTVTFTAAGTYTFELEASDGIDSDTDDVTITVYAEADDHLVAHWDFQNDLDEIVENTDPTSETWPGKTPLGPTDLDGTAGGVSAIAYVNGVASKEGSDTAISLDGTNWVLIDVDPNWLHFDDEITVSAWIRTATAAPFPVNTWPGIVTKGNSSWRIAVDGSGATAEMASGLYGNDDFSVVAGVQTVTNATWKHIVGTYGNGQIKIYIDGILDTTADASYPIAKNDWQVMIGANAETTPPRAILADIDEVRIFDRGLSAARVLAMYAGDGGGNACGQNYADSDFNQDCKTDADDLRIMVAEWLDCTDLTGVNCN